MLPRSSVVDYRALSARAPDAPLDGIVQFFKTELPSLWRDAYVATGKRPAEVFLIQRGEFEFLFDDYLGLEDRGDVPPEPGAERVESSQSTGFLFRPGRGGTITGSGVGWVRRRRPSERVGTRVISSPIRSGGPSSDRSSTSSFSGAISTAGGPKRGSDFEPWSAIVGSIPVRTASPAPSTQTVRPSQRTWSSEFCDQTESSGSTASTTGRRPESR